MVTTTTIPTEITALEFYSGVGGLHLALQRSHVVARLLAAFDWDQASCRVYRLNFPQTLLNQVDICTLSASNLASYHADLWLMSPSCQPYTSLNPSPKDDADPRGRPFLHLIHTVLPDLAALDSLPRYLLVENVAGFETSNTRSGFVSRLKNLGYSVIEFLLTPSQLGIPNSRLRYYLVAKLVPYSPASSVAHSELATGSIRRRFPRHGVEWTNSADGMDDAEEVREIRRYLDEDERAQAGYAIPHRVLRNWGRLFDIVLPSYRHSCCFTRGYTRLVEGAGSILQMNEKMDTDEIFERFLQAQPRDNLSAVDILDCLQLRYFTPSELLCLFGFQRMGEMNSFKWPEDMSNKTKYRLIGNSVNIDVVAHLIKFLLQ